ncbi:MAG: flagellar FlbD family protein [Thermoflexaceae bacterium]|nr:flagellar FlbD family protein [Thermoflexaceae bacterium]
MIRLTRIDGTNFYINPDLIEMVEATHDTHITLVNGHRYVCAESPEQIADLIVEYRRASVGAVRRVA